MFMGTLFLDIVERVHQQHLIGVRRVEFSASASRVAARELRMAIRDASDCYPDEHEIRNLQILFNQFIAVRRQLMATRLELALSSVQVVDISSQGSKPIYLGAG